MTATPSITMKGKLVWAGLILFVAGWMFVLGIMVGRGTIPLSSTTPSIDTELAQKITAKAAEEVEPPKQDLVYPEVLKNMPPPPKVKPSAPKADHTKPPEPKVQSSRGPTTAPADRHAAEESAIVDTPPVSVSSVRPKKGEPVATEDDRPTGQYTVQVAAVKEVQNAERLVQSLRNKGFEAYQIRSETKDHAIWYRVRVGAFRNRAEAEKTLDRLTNHNIRGIILFMP